jgi:hypothetical protein
MEVLAGKVLHFYSRISVASVAAIDTLSIGDLIHIKGHVTDFDQRIESMEFRHQGLTAASGGMTVGIKVKDYVRKNDCVYKIDHPA